jgi:hypothetical protein
VARDIDFLEMNLRFWDFNHSPHFVQRVLWINDGFPIYVSRSQNDFIRRMTNSGKYKDFVAKADLMIAMFGAPLDYGFTPHGKINDGPLHTANLMRRNQLRPWERGLGDKAYVGSDEYLTEFKKPPLGELTVAKKQHNAVIQHYRGRNEALVAQVKNGRKTLNTRWRGSVSLLAAILKIAIHMTALQERMKGPRFDCYGPWLPAPLHVIRQYEHLY